MRWAEQGPWSDSIWVRTLALPPTMCDRGQLLGLSVLQSPRLRSWDDNTIYLMEFFEGLNGFMVEKQPSGMQELSHECLLHKV